MRTDNENIVSKGRTPMYKATEPAMDRAKMYKGMTKNIMAM